MVGKDVLEGLLGEAGNAKSVGGFVPETVLRIDTNDGSLT